MPAALTADKALASAREAHARALELEEQAAAARTKGQQIDADSVDLIVENPAKAEDVTRQVETQERLARAYATKAAAEHTRAKEHALDALYREAAALDKEAEKRDKDAAKLAQQIAEAHKALEELADAPYVVGPTRTREDGTPTEWAVPADEQLLHDAVRLRRQAAQNRYYVEHGEPATTKHQLDVADVPHSANALAGYSLYDTITEQDRTDLLNRVINGTVYDEAHQ